MMLDGGIGGRDDPMFASLTDLFNEEKARHDEYEHQRCSVCAEIEELKNEIPDLNAEEDRREGFDGRGETMGWPKESKDVSQQEACGCVGLGHAVNFCPLHEAAPELLGAAKALLHALTNCPGSFNYSAVLEDKAREAIANAERRQ